MWDRHLRTDLAPAQDVVLAGVTAAVDEHKRSIAPRVTEALTPLHRRPRVEVSDEESRPRDEPHTFVL